MYQGKVYTTGEVWDDGCTYTCVCIDGMTGNYRCTEKYEQLSPYLYPTNIISDWSP